MKQSTVALLILILGVCLKANAQWEASVKYIYQPQYNTAVYLEPSASRRDTSSSPLEIEVSIREKGSPRILHVKRYTVPDPTQQITPIRFNLPRGDYLIDLDLFQERYTYLQLGYTCAGKPGRIAASDLYLSYTPLAFPIRDSPILSPSLDKNKPVFFFLEIYSDRYDVLTARAVLYKEDKGESGATATYKSMNQINKILTLQGGKVSFSDKFELDKLEEGVYLIEILVYENDRQIEEKSTRFVIEWKGKPEIFTNINMAIKMMTYLLPEPSIDSMMSLPTVEAKRSAFLGHWQRLYPTEAETQDVRYFKKIETANALFTSGMPGWMTDQGKIYISYGEPVISSVEKAGILLQKWAYPDWNLSFLFEKRNQVFYLIE